MKKIKIENLTERNNNYRKVVYTASDMQIVLMSLKPGEQIGLEKHKNTTQFFRIESGKCKITSSSNQRSLYLSDGDAAVVPHNMYHNVVCIGNEPVKIYTIYSNPLHSRNCVQRTTDNVEC